MQDSKSLYSKCFEEYRLSDEKIKKLQHELLLMLVDFKSVCDKYQIDYMLCGGTTLGAVRHQGFIPWDDDIDVMMLRGEYNKFKDVFRKEFSDRYELVEPLSDPRYVSKMVKIFKKGTSFVEIPTAGVGGPDMIFIDVFLIENMPAPGLKRFLKTLAYNTAFRAASVCIDYQYPSPPILEKEKSNPRLKRYYSFRRALGFLFTAFGSIQFYLRICEKIAAQTEKTDWLGIPSDSGYSARIYPYELFSEITETLFCGYMMKIPQGYDFYLRHEYGDYMQIPPPEKREYHVAYKISFEE